MAVEWTTPQKDELNSILGQLMMDLAHQVRDAPSFESVVGLGAEEMVDHARKAIAVWMSTHHGDLDPTSAEPWIQVYCLGFIIGQKYGEGHSQHMEQDEDDANHRESGDQEGSRASQEDSTESKLSDSLEADREAGRVASGQEDHSPEAGG